MLTPEEVRDLSRPSAFHAWRAIVADWLIIALIFGLVMRWPHPLVYLLGIILMARQQLALALLMHDAAHGRLFESRTVNDRVTQLFCAGPILIPLYTYKRGHLKHHQDPLTPGDPDIILIGGYPTSRNKLLRKLLQDLSGLSYIKFLRFFAYQAKRHRRSAAKRSGSPDPTEKISRNFVTASIVSSNGLLLGILWALGHPWLYFILWTIPSMTFLQCYLRVRGLAEHAGYGPNPNQMLNARTIVNPLQTFLVAPHNVNYHIEHHIYPSIPFFRLPSAHRLLKKRGALPKSNVFDGYGKVMLSLVTP